MRVEDEPRVVVQPRPYVTRRLAAWWVVGALVLVAVIVAQERLLWASVLLSSALGLGALLRLLLPTESAGGLVVRSRGIDVALLGGLAVAVLVSGLSLDLTPR